MHGRGRESSIAANVTFALRASVPQFADVRTGIFEEAGGFFEDGA